MKKLSLVLGALIMTFIMSSCANKKDAVIAVMNTFFNDEMTALNNVANADQLLEYIDAAEGRFNAFFEKMDKEYPITEDDEFIGFSKEDSDAAMQVYNDRMDAYLEARDTKGGEYYEPYLAEAETVLDELGQVMEPYDSFEDVPEELSAPLMEKLYDKYNVAKHYVAMSTDEQFDRFYVLYDIFDAEEEEAEEVEEVAE
ncbi:MAG: hypothetical protein IKM99_03705 [Bacteroidales bacterium]|nr:hypothetical protein [Bacteroidales bacterium]